jgi:hypothetical protein
VTEREIAQQGQEKFEFYLISLVFTLLALAVQSASFAGNHIKNGLELCSWLFLLLSGLAGLFRLQWIPVARIHMADKRAIEEEVFKLKELQLRGQTELHVLETNSTQSIAERMHHRKTAMEIYDPVIKRVERKVQVSYELHKYTFVIGVSLVACARGYEPAKDIISAIF